MKTTHLILAAALLSTAGCKQVWSTTWVVAATPVYLACTPYNAAWDSALSLADRGFLEHGTTRPMWLAWRDGIRGESASWAAPLVLLVLPLVTILQPLPNLLWAKAVSHAGG